MQIIRQRSLPYLFFLTLPGHEIYNRYFLILQIDGHLLILGCFIMHMMGVSVIFFIYFFIIIIFCIMRQMDAKTTENETEKKI